MMTRIAVSRLDRHRTRHGDRRGLPARPARQDAQPRASLKPVIYKPLKHDLSPRLDSMLPIEPVPQDLNRVRVNRFLPSRLKMAKQLAQIWQDPVAQLAPGLGLMPSPVANFEGVPNVSGVLPPDTQGDVGPNHYVQWVNLAFAIYDKTGTQVYPGVGYADGNTLWTGFGGECENTNDGDPITLYDQQAGRWLMSQFAVSGTYTQCIAVSQTGDPTGAWYRYAYAPFGNKMNDYPKFGVWPDGYYMTINQFVNGSTWGGAGVVAFERDKMLAGLAAQAVYFDLYNVDSNLGGMLPSDLDGSTPPPAGSPNYFLQVDDDGLGYPADQIELFKFHVDWANVANSTFTGPTIINLTSLGYGFDTNMCAGSRSCIPQPDTTQGLDAISDRLMYRLAYRNFGDHESLVVNHTVDVSGTDHAGIRWYELRAPNGTPVIHQAGTYAPDADHRWMGSIAMDAVGNVALGYSVSSATTYPSVRYAGRLAGDPAGTMGQAEATMMAGTGSQTHTAARWGDYSMMGIDPTDDCTFWYTQEYIQTTGSAPWQTRIGSFKFPTCTAGPAGGVAGTVTESGNALPIQGVRVQLGAVVETLTSADGTYQLQSVPVGVYDLTFSKLGYVTQTLIGVSVVNGQVTTQNAALVASPPATVSGIVQDGSGHGWPLYARIDVAGAPSKTVYTDPATGQYTISLWAGGTYQLTATAVAPGYQATTAPATPAGDPATATVDFFLAIDSVACTAPGYSNSAGAFYSVDFEGSNGSFVAAGTNSSWAWGAPVSGPGNAHSGTNVWATNLAGNYNTNENSTLTSPLIDLSAFAGQGPILSWWQWLQTESLWDYAYVDVSANGGSTWATVYGPVSGTIDSVWTKHNVTLGPSYAVSGFRVRFRLVADFIYDYPGWYVDDVAVAIGCNPVPGGMVVGSVADANTGNGLVGATVTSVAQPTETTTTVSTPADPSVPDGFYQLFSSATGTVAFDAARSGGYATLRADVPVVADHVAAHDYHLLAGRIAAAPAALTVSLELGTTTTRQLTLTNDGGVAAAYQIKEIQTAAPQAQAQDGASQAVASGQLPPDKAYYDAPTAAGVVLENRPEAPPLAAGEVVQSWSSGLAGPWGVAFDSLDNTVWVSSPVAAWGGENRLAEYSRAGVATGRFHTYTWAPASGPADGAFNWNTGRMFVMNVQTGVANCIFEMDPATGVTGTRICPGGGAGFATSQRGVAYDPLTDTWYAGGWTDLAIYHFSSAGTILDSKVVGLGIAGLAYNPDTHHLFVMISGTPTSVYVLDTQDNYSVVGQFSIAGFGDFAGAGLEIGCNGHLWANNLLDGRTYEIDSGETTTVCTADFPWLSVDPASGSVPPASSQIVTVTFDARESAGITQTGEYTTVLAVREDTPYAVAAIPVTMSVTAPCTFTIDPTSAAPAAGGGPGSVAVTASAPGCGWTAVSNDAWITVDPGTASGTGAGTVNYTVAANPLSTSRDGTVTIGGQTFTVTQAGALVITSLTADRTFPFQADGVTAVTWTAVVSGGVAPLRVSVPAVQRRHRALHGCAELGYEQHVRLDADDCRGRPVFHWRLRAQRRRDGVAGESLDERV